MTRQVRVLLAWMERSEAISALLGFRVPAEGEDLSAQALAHEAARGARAAREPVVAAGAGADPLPPVIAERGNQLLAELAATRHSNGVAGLRTAIVDLRNVLSIQRVVALDGLAHRVARAAPDDWNALADICLPVKSGDDDVLQGTFDKDGRGITITSPNPNLRVSAISNAVLAGGVKMLGFQVLFGTRHVHVAEYENRYFLTDGYHRAYGLLERGIMRVPCVLHHARSFGDVHAGDASMIPAEDCLGPRPAALLDFFDPSVSATIEQPVLRKTVRIRADEFAVNV